MVLLTFFCIFALLEVINQLNNNTMEEKIIENGYKLAEMREELAEELEQLDPTLEVDKEFIDVNRKLSEALRQYIKTHYGEWVLYRLD